MLWEQNPLCVLAFRQISLAKRHRTSCRTKRMGLKYAGSNEAEQNSNLFGPKGFVRSDQVRALLDGYYRRDCHST